MRRPRPPSPFLAYSLALLACAAWAIPSQHVSLYIMRALYQLGESTHITPRGPLAGQILGFNYSHPPVWYEFLVHTAAALGSLAPALIPALWFTSGCRLLAKERRAGIVRPSRVVGRGVSALLIAGVVYTILSWQLTIWLWQRLVDLGERLGATVTRSGAIGVGTRGPFMGSSIVDDIGNYTIAYLPRILFASFACWLAMRIHAMLWRPNLRAAALLHLCPKCGYDLSATPTSRPCPECGAASNLPRGGDVTPKA